MGEVRGYRSWGAVAVCALAVGCSPPTCSDIECVMSHFALTMNGQAVEMTEVPAELVPMPSYTPSSSASSSGSFDLLIMPVSMPNFGDPLELIEAGYAAHAGSGMPDESAMPTIGNQPADVNLLFADSEASFELDVDDPNGATPGFFIIPADPASGRIFTRCVWMTHAQRDFLRQLMLQFRVRINAVTDFAATGFWTSSCNTLPPRRSLVLPLGPDACPTGTQRCGDDSCIPNTTLCTPGAGTCGSNMHLCGANCVPRAQQCCTFDSQDPGCCQNGPGVWPCVPPIVAGPPAQNNFAPARGGNGGGGNNNGGGGGPADEVWNLTRGDQIARVTIHGGAIHSDGTPQWQNFNNAGDCSFPLLITGQMSGTAFDFTVMGAGCVGYEVQGTGMGTANGVFGVATMANVPYTESDKTPGGTVPQSGNVAAVRVQ